MSVVSMKRVFIMAGVSSLEELLRKLEGFGVLHPERIAEPKDAKGLEDFSKQVKEHHNLIVELSVFENKGERGKVTFDEVKSALSELKHLRERREIIQAEIDRQEMWGDIDPLSIEDLKGRGKIIQLWQSRSKELTVKLPVDAVILSQGYFSGVLYFATFANKSIQIEDALEMQVPHRSTSNLNEELKHIDENIAQDLVILSQMASGLSYLRGQYQSEIDQLNFKMALEGSYKDDAVAVVSGWLPSTEINTLKKNLNAYDRRIAIKFRDPEPSENPPIATRNIRVVKIFDPLLNLLGFPDYRSVDPSYFFAPFMFLFFGICFGDAGYGVLMSVISLFVKKFFRKKFPVVVPIANLTFVFGIATIFWGIITGAFFGIELPVHLQRFVLFDFSVKTGDPLEFFKISIGLGIFHLAISYLIKILRAPSIDTKLAETGKFLVLFAGTLGLIKFEYWWWILIAGLFLVLTFSSPDGNPLKRFGLGLWNVYGLTGMIGDVMSYARLFGLGISTSAIASVVNQLARMAEPTPHVGVVFMILILIVGHTFNFVMGIIGSIVHPLRLHAVEAMPKFTSLTGEPYRPLGRREA